MAHHAGQAGVRAWGPAFIAGSRRVFGDYLKS